MFLPILILAWLFLLLCYKISTDRLKRFPGPRLAAWTDLWRVLDTYFRVHEAPSPLRLHRKYGDIVRVGPNTLTFSHPQAIKDIYGTDNKYPKPEMYYTFAASAGGRVSPSLFSSLDLQWHDRLRRAVNPAFTLSALVQYEPFVESTIRELVTQFETRFAGREGKEGIVDLERWMHWYAFDVVGELTYGSPFGALKNGSDVDRILEKTRRFLAYGMWAGCMPLIDYLTFKNPVLLWLNRRGYFNSSPNPVIPWALRYQAARQDKPPTKAEDESGPQDLIVKFLQAKETHPDIVGDKEVLSMGLTMVLAGSESTGVTLTALIYFLLKNPEVYRKLQREIDEAFPSTDDQVSFKQAFALPYLDACVKETFRMHPAARFTGERVLPPEGANISGEEIPGGTIVGLNAWALHRREDVFGNNVDNFVPARWLPTSEPASEQEQARIDAMARTLFHFGAGRFNCIGKNISLLEMYKVIPVLLRTFDFTLDDPEKEWRYEDGSFVNVSGVEVRLRKR